MARVYLTTKALIQLVLGQPVDPRVPKPYFEVEQRLLHCDEVWESMLRDSLTFAKKIVTSR